MKAAVLAILAASLLACSPEPSPTPSPLPASSPTPGVTLTALPDDLAYACVNLGADRCERLLAELPAQLTADEIPQFVSMIQRCDGGSCDPLQGDSWPAVVSVELRGDRVPIILEVDAESDRMAWTRVGDVEGWVAVQPRSAGPLRRQTWDRTATACPLVDVAGSFWNITGTFAIETLYDTAGKLAEFVPDSPDQARLLFDGGATFLVRRHVGQKWAAPGIC